MYMADGFCYKASIYNMVSNGEGGSPTEHEWPQMVRGVSSKWPFSHIDRDVFCNRSKNIAVNSQFELLFYKFLEYV